MSNISTLVPVEQETIGDSTVNTVDGRKLHSYLEVQKDYTSWMKAQIKRAKLIENVDYLLTQKGEKLSSGTKYSSDYHLTLEAGKHVAMISGTAKGREVRDYFIECERKAFSPAPVAAVKDPILAAHIQALVAIDSVQQEQKRQASELESMKQLVSKIEAKTQPDNEFYTVAGYARMLGQNVDLPTAAGLGKRCSIISKNKGMMVGKVSDPRFGIVNTYHESVLQVVFNH